MVRHCGVVGCTSDSRKTPSLKFFRVPRIVRHQGPRDEDLSRRRRIAWVAALNRKSEDLTEEKLLRTDICQKHFASGQPAHFRYDTNVDWAPTLELHPSQHWSFEKTAVRKARDDRRKIRDLSKREKVDTPKTSFLTRPRNIVEEMSSSFEEFFIKVDSSCQTNSVNCHNCKSTLFNSKNEKQFVSQGTQTDETGEHFDDLKYRLKAAYQDNDNLRKELFSVKEGSLSVCDFKIETFKKSDFLVKFYTGLINFTILKAFFDVCEKYVSHNSKNALSKFSEFILVMIKLRLNVPYRDLAFRFNVDETTASRIFNKWIDGMYYVALTLIHWPDRETLINSMPTMFKKCYGNTVSAIIDCFEIFIIRPSNLKARTLTWSHYESHNTVKYLISITPQGTVNFVSEGWGGKVSDKQITEESGFLAHLEPGDRILADRGFTIEDLLSEHFCSLEIPAFTRNKPQFEYMDTKTSREISNLRIHVERIIGLIRNKYPILAGKLSIDLISVKDEDMVCKIDKIVKVCCALVNLCPSIVSADDEADIELQSK